MPATKKTSKISSIDDLLNELETIVKNMECGNMSLEESVIAYREGVKLVKKCKEKINKAREEIRILDEDSQQTVPMESAKNIQNTDSFLTPEDLDI